MTYSAFKVGDYVVFNDSIADQSYRRKWYRGTEYNTIFQICDIADPGPFATLTFKGMGVVQSHNHRVRLVNKPLETLADLEALYAEV